jgi:hypothetical protein
MTYIHYIYRLIYIIYKYIHIYACVCIYKETGLLTSQATFDIVARGLYELGLHKLPADAEVAVNQHGEAEAENHQNGEAEAENNQHEEAVNNQHDEAEDGQEGEAGNIEVKMEEAEVVQSPTAAGTIKRRRSQVSRVRATNQAADEMMEEVEVAMGTSSSDLHTNWCISL